MRIKLLGLLLSFSLLLCGCTGNTAEKKNSEEAVKKTQNVFAMNTYITLTAYGENAKSALTDSENRIRELEKLLSVTDESSEIYMVNHSGGAATTLSPDTENVISFALEMANRTNGALEPTIYPVLTAWGFTTETYRIPTQETIDRLMQSVGFEKVQIQDHSLLLPDGMQLDLGAVAKGYASDEVVSLLKSRGVTSAIISLGGNVQAVGTKPDGSMWRVGLKSPDADGYIGILEVSDCAVVTSGGYQKYFTGEDGKTYHHIIDPSTGRPAESGLVSVTVVGKEGKQCDALSTALFVMGEERAIEFWQENGGFDMILLTDANEMILTEGLEHSFTVQEAYASYPVTVIRP